MTPEEQELEMCQKRASSITDSFFRCWECGPVNLPVSEHSPLTFPFPQIPARRGWSGSGRHPGGVRGHGARWGAHRPHPALWYTPLPGPVAQPALQTRRDQRAPHRAIAAEGIQNGNISPDPSTLRTNQSQSDRPTGTKRQ